MAKKFEQLSEAHIQFIREQHIYFVGTATADSRVNVSPKGMDSLIIPDSRHVAWLNVTGSGNETAAHVLQSPRMTIMFCAFNGPPLILRLYGTARVIHRNDAEWHELFPLFKPLAGARQIFAVTLDLVQTSCGMATPYFRYEGERELLSEWATRQGGQGLRQYWEARNQLSLDGLPSQIVARNC